jgi:class 3 adenylate cyclase
VVDEPVRGRLPDPSFYSLPGIEQARAWVHGDAPTVPLSHLMGFRLTQVGTGSATATQPATPALQSFDGAVEGLTLMLETMTLAVLTGAPPASSVRAAAFAVDHLRPSTLESETLVTKARTLHSGRTFTLAEATLEDSAGRGVAHGKATFVIRPIEPPPPPWAGFAGPLDTPVYATPDPYLREVPEGPAPVDDEIGGLELLAQIARGERQSWPSQTLFGMRLVDVSEGTLSASLRASEWLCCLSRAVSSGVIAYLAHSAHGAVATLMPAGHRFGILNQSVSFLCPVAPDGGELLARGAVTHRGDEFLISHVEVTDDAGRTVAVGTQTSLFLPRRSRKSSGTQPLRMLATVLFTDIVGSTERAESLGDARWSEVLDDHHAFVRKQLQLFKGQEVKTTGDGFLATFNSPGRAVQAARAIREGVQRLGLEIRAGLHTGECEVTGADVAGIAVHLASRVLSLADPREILVTGTVHDLVTGSGIRFADRGRHKLKGIEGEWQLFALQ